MMIQPRVCFAAIALVGLLSVGACGGSSVGSKAEVDASALPADSGLDVSDGPPADAVDETEPFVDAYGLATDVESGLTHDALTESDTGVASLGDATLGDAEASVEDPPIVECPPCAVGWEMGPLGCRLSDDPLACARACPVLPNARNACQQATCVVGSCRAGWLDCGGPVSDGCETSSSDPANCGACGHACAPNQLCREGSCVDGCPPPLQDCAGSCVDIRTDPLHCGGCELPCLVSQSRYDIPTCEAKQCQTKCAPEATLCGTECMDLQTAPTDCGKCRSVCNGTCRNGTCHCSPGETLCGADCRTLSSDPLACGQCGHSCSDAEVCVRGTCATEDTLRWIGGLTNPGTVITYQGWTYWADNTANSVSRARYPSTDVEVVATFDELPSLLAVDATHLYVANSNAIAGAIYRATLGGHAPAELVALGNQLSGLVVDDANIYWASSDGVFALPKSQVGTGQQTPIPLSTEPSHGLQLYEGILYDLPESGKLQGHLPPGESTADAGRPLVFEAVGPRSYLFYLACGHLDSSWDFQGTHIRALGLNLYSGVTSFFIEKGGYLYVTYNGRLSATDVRDPNPNGQPTDPQVFHGHKCHEEGFVRFGRNLFVGGATWGRILL